MRNKFNFSSSDRKATVRCPLCLKRLQKINFIYQHYKWCRVVQNENGTRFAHLKKGECV